MADDYESALEEKPLEFLTSIANSGGSCDGQAIVPDGDHYRAWCSCGEWAIEAPSQEAGLHLARVHTGSVPA
ncbi:hypothetical protein [Cryptosporangium sp. NPDC048952]|uniref:hypothetical protein n=1 Tax=Cryptosporangium sp. NPDC048952 TaxID=3363961 RepID=UPI00371FB2B8